MTIRPYTCDDVAQMTAIWNEVVESGDYFPQTDTMDTAEASGFFAAQTHCAVACEKDKVLGLYILHPNNIGRCGHICNASYAVSSSARGKGIGRLLVRDCMRAAANAGFRILQFNAVVADNAGAIALYESMGFTRLGRISGGYLAHDGSYKDIILFYIKL